MRRNKQDGASGGFGGDWSESGTFLRKPASGWLHEDTELMDNSCINYEVEYLGSVGVSQSMRTLQFSVRTQVTKEAILRLAEGAGKVYVGKKRKVPKQINKLLGAADTRQAGPLNLSISVEDLKINDSGGAVLIRHSLPSISFASGGDGPTLDFIGYVAKDPVHGRACHVFECRESSQYVLTTIGQAFELRYKLYLKTPRPNVHPVEVEDTWGQDAWGSQRNRSEPEPHSYTTSVEVHSPGTTPLSPLTTSPPLPLPPPLNTNIYDDVPQTPPPVPEGRPQVYSNLPAFPVEDDDEFGGPHGNKPSSSTQNPYDTMFVENMPVGATAAVTSSRHHHSSQPPPAYSEAGVYSDPGEVSGKIPRTYSDPNYEDSDQLMTIRQIPSNVAGDTNDEIDLTPALPINDYSNLGPNGEVLDEPLPTRKRPHPPKKPPRPPEMMNGSATLYDDAQSHVPQPRQNHYGNQPPPRSQESPDEDLYGNREVERVLALNDRKRLASNEYEDAEALDNMVSATPPVVSHTPAGTYDNPDEIMGSVGGAGGMALGGNVTGIHKQPVSVGLREGVYDIAETNEAELYDDAASVDPQRISQTPMSPKFDDVIYMKQGETPSPPLGRHKPTTPPVPHSGSGGRVTRGGASVKPPPARKPPALRNLKSLSQALPDAPAPLPRQKYFHGPISRIEAEALLEKDGQFLIRESSKRPGQYVLTGMANGQPQHLLLMDKEGKVKSKDHEFESIPHLVAYFTEKKVPLVIGGAQVYLKDCIVSISSYR